MSKPIIQLNGYSYRYPGAEELALKNITLTIDEGDFIGVIGCNRAGKSTLCKSVVGILPFVPGGGIYYTMEYCLSGDTQLFLSTGIHTFGVAGAVAVGLLLVSSLVRLLLGPANTARKEPKP